MTAMAAIVMTESDIQYVSHAMDKELIQSPKPKRKRQRLDHLSNEEKLMRRKLKNRMAAQSARDRKKVKMHVLEKEAMILAKQRNALLIQNEKLVKSNESLEQQNRELKRRLGLLESKPSIKSEINDSIVWNETIESAAGTGLTSGQSVVETECTAIDDAIRLLADHKESDALLDVLRIYSEELLDSHSDPEDGELQTIDQLDDPLEGHTPYVGSVKDLMTIDDHLYYKSQLSTDSMDTTSDSIDMIDTNYGNNDYIPNPMSPLSCGSDSGYESLPSPPFKLDHKMVVTSDDTLDHTFTELFPDLI